MIASTQAQTLPNTRPSTSKRTFHSTLVENYLQQARNKIKDDDLKRLFANSWTSTLDTTVWSHDSDELTLDHLHAKPETWIITGDISAMWLRDSANQVDAYMPLLASSSPQDAGWNSLYRLLLGTVYTQARCILLHPFSNAFIPPTSNVEPSNSDFVRPKVPSVLQLSKVMPTTIKDDKKNQKIRVWESKWELDSLASFVDLSSKLAQASNRTDLFYNQEWNRAMRLVLKICKLQQRGTDEEVELLQTPWLGPNKDKQERQEETIEGMDVNDDKRYQGRNGVYRFTRETRSGSETRPLSGLGEPAKRCGLIKSAFRPSDDATVFPFLIPSNAFMAQALLKIADQLDNGDDATLSHELKTLATDARELGQQVTEAVWTHGVVETIVDGVKRKVFAYEVDGFGSYLLADDANLPSLLSLPYLRFINADDPVYINTRQLVLSARNKWFFKGKAAQGIGGMHVGEGFIWPMSIITRALTSDDDEEILECLDMLKKTTAGTGLIHESFYKDDARNYTRSWFAWASGLFGVLIMQLLERAPHLLM
ncbi:hypothetical protein OIO90_004430 [Microbotryomycetes sp. JL221]|nr:hypothetical protein OIO90_004430 [Microbotryomycetes sp. JL221]